MALTPADFAAYSRATGTPYPEDPQERAALAPEVIQFRQNQLRAPQQESNPLAVLGAAALGIGALAGGIGLASRLGRAKAVSQPTGTTQDVRKIDAFTKQRAAESLERELRQERPQGVVQTDLSAIDKLLDDPGLLSQVEYEENLASLTPEELREFRGKESRARNEYRRLITEIGDESIAQDLAATQVALSSQALNALESGEDQITGRTLRGVQRNEDLDASQVNELTNQTGSAQVAASMTPDGVPSDQTTFTFREKIYLQPGQKIQQQARRVESWRKPTDVTLIGRYPAVQEQISFPERGAFPRTLGESGGETIFFTPVDPHQGRTNIQRGGVEFTVQEGRIAGIPARVTVLPRGTEAEGRLGPAVTPAETMNPEQVAAKIAEFQLSKEAQIQNAMERGLSKARARRNVQMTESQQSAIEADLPGYSPEDVMSRTGVKSYGDMGEAERYTEEMASKTGRLQALEEGGFLEEQVDPGELRQEPRQVRPGVMVRPASKTSYRGITGQPGVGIYGEQAPGRAGDPSFGAGSVEAKKEIKVEGEERGVTTPRAFVPGVDLPETRTPEGFVYTEEAMTQPTKARGGYKRYGTQAPTRPEAASDALSASLELTRLQREGKEAEAQAFLDKMMQERGVSVVGSSQPLRQQRTRKGRS